MKHFATLICLFLIAGNALAQVNLVPNGSFEERDGCPMDLADIDECDGWWPLHGSPDFFHRCGAEECGIPINFCGNQEPHNPLDSAYAGFTTYTTLFPGGQESLYISLTEPMVAGIKYRVKFKVNSADFVNYSTCCVGVIFGNSPPPSPPVSSNLTDVEIVLDPNTLDQNVWYEVNDTYTAFGGENKMFVGNFRPDSESQPTYIGPTLPVLPLHISTLTISKYTQTTLLK